MSDAGFGAFDFGVTPFGGSAPVQPPAIGSQADILARLQRWLPQGWFPNTSGTRIYAILSGFASVLATIYGFVAYTKLQTRIATSTDGFLDLAGQDYYGTTLPRLLSETDGSYSARLRANLTKPSNTKLAISETIQNIAGFAPRVMEPWNNGDTGGYDISFFDVDTASNPARYDPSLRATIFIESRLPQDASIGNAPMPAYDAVACYDAWTGAFIDLGLAGLQSETSIYSAVSRTKAEGVTAWVKFVSARAGSDALRVWDAPNTFWDN